MKFSINNQCPCGSKQKYKKCCKIFHEGSNPRTALDLMKSRYTAYVLGDSKYIMNTTHKSNIDYSDDKISWSKAIKDFSDNSEFNSLNVINFEEKGNEAFVTFKVSIFQSNEDISFVEKSKFLKEDNKWLYHSGEFL